MFRSTKKNTNKQRAPERSTNQKLSKETIKVKCLTKLKTTGYKPHGITKPLAPNGTQHMAVCGFSVHM